MTVIASGLLETLIFMSPKISKPRCDLSSFKTLIDREISQSECIQMGIVMEKFLKNLISKTTPHTNIKPKNTKGKKERDILFINDDIKTVYYFEIKNNINLDTEKSKETSRKINIICKELETEYQGFCIESALVSTRYLNSIEIPKIYVNKYNKNNHRLIGINDLLELVGSEIRFTFDEYKEIVNKLANNF